MKIKDERIFSDNLTSESKVIEISGKEFHHLIKVRRFAVGDTLWATNGQSLTANVVIESISSQDVILKVEAIHENVNELPYKLNLAMANLKGSHFEDAIEKSIELGVVRVLPLKTGNTIKTGLKIERLEKIAQSTLKQSRGSVLAQIDPILPYQKVISECNKDDYLNLFCVAHQDSVPIWEALSKEAPKTTTVWIGPEGDWTDHEIQMAKEKKFKFVHLGTRRLRAETAAVVATGVVSQWIYHF